MEKTNTVSDLSESFLHFLDDNSYNKNNQSYCEEKTNIYHDSTYIWCKVCDKILCLHCSMNHLLNNQIDHSSNRIFLRKEHLDCEYNNDFGKLESLKKIIDNFYIEGCKTNFDIQYKSLKEVFRKFKDIKNELINIINNFQNKIQLVIDNIEKINNNIFPNDINENNMKKSIKDLSNKLKTIENKYVKCPEFIPTQIKHYHDCLSDVYNDYQNLSNVISSINKTKISIGKENEQKHEKIKIILNNAINNIKSFIISFQIVINEKKI